MVFPGPRSPAHREEHHHGNDEQPRGRHRSHRDHRDHDDAARRELRGIAIELGLVVTGSSDYHGAGKDNLLGENRTDPAAFEAITAAASGSAYLPA